MMIVPVPDRWLKRTLIAVLRRLQIGELTLITPERETWHFVGRRAGPVADVTLHDWQVVQNLFLTGDNAFSEDYTTGKWDTEEMPALLLLIAENAEALMRRFHNNRLMQLWLHFCPRAAQRIRPDGAVAQDFYQIVLDAGLSHSAGLYEGLERSLEQAQEAKYQRALERMEAPEGASLLEIGCGWGGFMAYAAERNYRIKGLTLSQEQADFVKERLPGAEVAVQDYREEKGLYDAVVSIEMFEAVGAAFWPLYFATIRQALRKGGKALIQTTLCAEEYYQEGDATPSQGTFTAAAEKAGFQVLSVYKFGQDYAKTLGAWLFNLESQTPLLQDLGYSDACIRSWRFYLSHRIAAYTTRKADVMQVELGQ